MGRSPFSRASFRDGWYAPGRVNNLAHWGYFVPTTANLQSCRATNLRKRVLGHVTIRYKGI
jgi:hypothetical protein